MAKHKIPELRKQFASTVEWTDIGRRVCQVCDNFTTHYRILGFGKRWFCARVVSAMRRKTGQQPLGRIISASRRKVFRNWHGF